MATIAGASLMAYGYLRQGMAAKAAADYNAEVNEEQAREEGIRVGIIEDRLRRQKKQAISTQTARFLKAGVKLEGTPLEVLADTATQFEEDIAITKYDARVNVARLQAGAEAQRIAGKEAMFKAGLMAGGTVLSGYGMSASSAAPAATKTAYGYWAQRIH